jgi:triacylglycerol lipase
MLHPIEIFLKLLGGFLLLGTAAAAIVAWAPSWAEIVSRQLISWKALGLALVLGFGVWKLVPAAWWPTLAIPILGLALMAIPMILGILLFPVEMRDGRPIAPDQDKPAGLTLVDRLQAPWSSLTDARPPAVVDLARCALIAYETPPEWQRSIPKLGFPTHGEVIDGSAKGVVMVVGNEAVIAFQGTDDFGDWFRNLDNDLATAPDDGVHRGFLKAYRSVAGQIKTVLADQGIKHVWITGHSLGGAMAVLCAIDLVREQQIDVRGVITFGQPLLLSPTFALEANHLLEDRHMRFIHEDDIVPRVVPGLRGGGSSMWMKDGQVIFGGPRMRALAVNGEEAMTLDIEEGPEPLTDEEFEREKSRLTDWRAESYEPGPDGVPRMQALPNAEDHPMSRYLDVIERHFDRGPAAPASRQPEAAFRPDPGEPTLARDRGGNRAADGGV